MSEPLDRVLGEPPVAPVRAAVEGAERDAWLVGGTVRDALLGRPLVDVDVAVAGDPEPLARAIAAAIGGPVFRLSEDFGAWRAIDRERRFLCDVSGLQGESIEADLARRDFTVNAMALPVSGGELLDPHGGRRDLAAGTLRVVGDRAYDQDPVRPLRLARLATELGFAPDSQTEAMTREAAASVANAAGERVFAEIRRLILSDAAVSGVELCERLGLLAAVLPEVAALRGVEQSHFHHLDVYEHTLEVLREVVELDGRLDAVFGGSTPRLRSILDEPLADELTRGEALRFGALLHDVGKPRTRSVRPDGRVTFIGHDSLGDGMVRDICERLRTSRRLGTFVGGLTRHHLTLGFMVHARPLSRHDVYRYLSTCSPVEVEVTVLSCADRLATRGRRSERAIAAHLGLAAELMRDALDWRLEGPPRPPVRGDELASELGLPPGPELGRLLRALEEARFTGEVETRAEAIDFARRARERASAPDL